MKIKLVLPICNKKLNTYKCNKVSKNSKNIKNSNNNYWYCYDSYYERGDRLSLLKSIIENSTDSDLIVTSNNYFYFCYQNNDNKLLSELNKITNKKDLLIGIDYKYEVNPYGGINAKIIYFKVENNKYIKSAEVWETYKCSNSEKTLERFKKQNKNRKIIVNNKSITLLSCGDITKPCFQNASNLPNTDIYIDLAHMSYGTAFTRPFRKEKSCSALNKYLNDVCRIDKIVLMTQQICNSNEKECTKVKKLQNSNRNFNKNYFQKTNEVLKYQFICPSNLDQIVEIKDNYIEVDVII
jgi:hypothetical protein